MTTERKPIPNKYAGGCARCGEFVPAGAGLLERADGRWVVTHTDVGACAAGTVTPSVPAAATVPSAAPVEFPPTVEQQACVDLFLSGESMVIDAGAGTGKTSTLRLIANATKKVGRYLAFNKAIVMDVQGSMPSNITASTAHSLAFQAIGKQYSKRLNGRRMHSSEIARRLGVKSIVLHVGSDMKVLQPDYLAGLVMRTVTRFCQSADEELTVRHVPYVDGIDEMIDGRRGYTNNNLVDEYVLPFAQAAWADLRNVDGQLPFRHDHYLKAYQLTHPKLALDFVLFDEAQDASPVLAAIVAEQDHAQRVYVGDANQAIYGFTGAVNAMSGFDAEHRRPLTQSFRFGPAIAKAANEILAQLDTDLKLRGFDKIDSVVGPIDGDPDAVLCRTNAMAVDQILGAKARGVSVHLIGGAAEILRFARAAQELQDTGQTGHPELACFGSWQQVLDYVEKDEQGDELKLNVDLVERYTVPVIEDALDRMPKEANADLVVSTAHKSKGREWGRVKLASDFVRQPREGQEEPPPPTPEELRLQYVAVTRASRHLDHTALSEHAEDAA